MNPRQYLGGYGVSADAGDGLLYMRARCQDPGSGVFISRNPIGLRGGLNLYGYVEFALRGSLKPRDACAGVVRSQGGREGIGW